MKKLLSLVLALILCSALFACGGENATPTTTSATTTNGTQDAATATAMTEEKAIEIVEDLALRYGQCGVHIGACDHYDELSQEEWQSVLENNPGKEFYGMLRKSSCCSTAEEALDHMRSIMTATEYERFEQNYIDNYIVEQNGSVYFIASGEGWSLYYGVEEIISFSENHIVALLYNEGEVGRQYFIFVIEKEAEEYKVAAGIYGKGFSFWDKYYDNGYESY